MTKAEAAELLGISERMVTTHASNGRLGTVRYVKGKTRDVADFDPQAVQRLKDELDAAKMGIRPREVGTEDGTPDGGSTEGESGALIPALGRSFTTHHSRQLEKVNREVTATVPDSQSSQFEALVELVAAGVVKAIGQGSSIQELAVKPLLSASEINTLYGVPERQTREAMKEGALPSAKIGRSMKARRVDVDKWINARFE